MAASPIPNIEELKAASGSNKLSKCLKFLFEQEVTEYEAFIMDMAEKCNQLRPKIEKRNQYIREARSFGPFNVVGATGFEFLMQTQVAEQTLLEELTMILAQACQAIGDKKHHVEIMDMEYSDDEV